MKSIVLVATFTLAAISPSWLPLEINSSANITPLTAPPAVSTTTLSLGHEQS